MSPAKKACKDIKAAICKREAKRARTFGIYSIHQPRSKEWIWTPPFIAGSDEAALNALVELSRVNPEICRKNVYRIAEWCSLDGKITIIKPVLLKGKANEK